MSVVLFHAAGWPRAGFVGVDIFFVISGFVVSLSMANVDATRFGEFAAFFYARRFVRIVPALSLCLLATMAVSCLFIPAAWLSNGNLLSGLAAFFGLSNIALARSTGDYFSPRAEFNPFTHTWSLGVEEQFYVVFPIAMFLFLRSVSRPHVRAWLWMALAVVGAMSLTLSAWWTWRWPPSAFYLAPARVWELAGGVALFMSMARWRPRLARIPTTTANVALGISSAALGVSLAVLGKQGFPFPGAIPPVLCVCAMLVLVVARPDLAVARTLSLAPVVYLGKISYSLYLWHWPVFVLMRWTVGIDSLAARAIAIAASLILAVLSYHLVESPIRRSRAVAHASRLSVIAGGLGAISVASAMAALLVDNESRISLSVTRDVRTWLPDSPLDVPAFPARCRVDETNRAFQGGTVMDFTPSQCDQASGRGRLIAVGDSHALAYIGMLRAIAANAGREVKVMARAGCPYMGLRRPMAGSQAECRAFDKAVLDFFTNETRAGDIVFLPSLRVPRYGDQWGQLEITPEKASDSNDRHSAVREAQGILGELARREIIVVFEAPPPVFRAPPFRCSDWFNATNPVCAEGFAIARAEIETLRRPAFASIQEVSAVVARATVWDPLPVLCPAETCNAFVHGRPLFFDADHLSGHANAVLLPSFMSALNALETRQGARPIQRP